VLRLTLRHVEQVQTCTKCGHVPAGPGGILCTGCRDQIAINAQNYWYDHPLGTSPMGTQVPVVAPAGVTTTGGQGG
jgi:hypothetical protein